MSENGRETSISSDAWSMPRRHYVLAVLCLVGIFNFVDRQIITILIEPIKKEFGASDTQMGLLTGLMFAGFYLAASIPLARIADTGSRRNLMVICLGCWSAMTALGGFAQSFIQLLLTRIGVALGEAGAGPASHSMISDLYPMRRRGTMLSIFIAAQSIGIGLGVFLGGLLGDMFNWRVAFVIVGVPGVLLAVLLLTTVKEPPRGMADNVSETAKPPPVFVTMKRLLGMPSYVCAVLTSMFGAIPGYGTLIWGPTFFLRVHELSAATVGFWFGIVSGAALFIGGISGGMVGDWAARRDVRWYMRLGGIGLLVAAPFGWLYLLSPAPVIAFGALFLMQVPLAWHNVTSFTIGQALAPVRMRATASVIMSIMVTLSGIGLAPLVVGALNDYFLPRFGPDAIRYSLTIMFAFAILASAASLLSTIWLKSDLSRTQTENAT